MKPGPDIYQQIHILGSGSGSVEYCANTACWLLYRAVGVNGSVFSIRFWSEPFWPAPLH